MLSKNTWHKSINTTGEWKQAYKCKIHGFTEFYIKRTLSRGYTRFCKICNALHCKKYSNDPVNHSKILTGIRKRNKILRIEFINAYGGKCDCCGESYYEFLTLDHIYGGGGKHRKKIKYNLLKVLKREGWPKDKYRLLCWNCNSALGRYGYCPHKQNVVKEVA